MRLKVKHGLFATICGICALVAVAAFASLIAPDIHGSSVTAGLVFIVMAASTGIPLAPHAFVWLPAGFRYHSAIWNQAVAITCQGQLRFLHARNSGESHSLICLRSRTYQEFTLAIADTHPDYVLVHSLSNGDTVIGTLNLEPTQTPQTFPSELLRLQRV